MSDAVNLYFNKPGMYTTVQDAGRIGYQQFGVPVGGAMDLGSAVLANRLVGNPENMVVLEITMIGPEIKIKGTAHIALTGAKLSPKLDGEEIAMNKSLLIKLTNFIFLRLRFIYRSLHHLAQ